MAILTLKSRIKPLQSSKIASQRIEVERKRGTTGVNDRNAIKLRDKGLCQECKRNGSVRAGAEVDHIVPLWKGGSDEASNKEYLCRPCHRGKTAREARERGKSSNY